MNGELKIKVTEKDIQITGVLKDHSMIERVAVVDALMNAFDMKGEKRKMVCDMLLSVDKIKTEFTDGEIADLLDKLFEVLKEK